MPSDLLLVLVMLAAAVVLFAIGRPRMDAVALMMMVALPLTGVIGVGEALAGLGDPNVVLIAALFVIGEVLVRTGVAQRLGDWLTARAGSDERRLVALLMLIVAGVGSVMSSTGVVALFIPVVLRIARKARLAPGRLMMPLSVAGLVSGMMTLIATPPNLVVNGELIRSGFEGFNFFSFTPFGASVLALAVGYMILVRRWLGRKEYSDAPEAPSPSKLAGWMERYRLAGRAHRLRVTSTSPLVGKPLDRLDLRGSAGINIIAIERRGRFGRHLLNPTAKTELRADDVLFLDLLNPAVDIEKIRADQGLEELPLPGTYFSDLSQEIGMVEVMLPETSRLVGKTALGSRFRSQYGLTVVGLRRGGAAQTGSVLDVPLKLGDTLLLVGPWRAIRRLQMERGDLIVIDTSVELDEVSPAAGRATHALVVLGITIVLMTTGVVPNVLAALIGCLAMGLLGCIDLESAYRAIHWQTLVLIVGMLPFAIALQRVGGVDLAVGMLTDVVGQGDPRLALVALFVVTAALGLFISNTATAVLMAPIALAVAEALEASPYPFAMIVALAASSAFMTPVSSPVNALVVGPGGYRFFDFVRIGVPFTLIVLVVGILLVPLLLPF